MNSIGIYASMIALGTMERVCESGWCEFVVDHDLKIMSKPRDYDDLKTSWINWRTNGQLFRDYYKEYVLLGNMAAVKNGFKTFDDLWLFPWETPDFKEQMEQLWKEMEGLYKKLHTYVRMKLRKLYPNKLPADGTIPAHILGNMWAQSWRNIEDLLVPFPQKRSIGITDALKKTDRMFHLSDKFFRDLGLIQMPDLFWNISTIAKPREKGVVCQDSAWDSLGKHEFRNVFKNFFEKMCKDLNLDKLITIHRQMGNIEYYFQYKDQPTTFQDGANPGFHGAIGDLFGLSASTPAHLNKLGLLTPLVDDQELILNYQMSKALEKMAFMPFAYIMDLYRWDIFSGKTDFDNWNRHWWQLRLKYQGISPPVKRPVKGFDIGSKYHFIINDQYIRYFVSFVIQFQFHKSLCTIAQPNVPLYKCDIDGNKEVGERLANALKLGSSRPWPDVMQILTGSRNMSAKPLLEYFEPLIKYLDNHIQNETIGWIVDVNQYMENSTETEMSDLLEQNPDISEEIKSMKFEP